MSFPKLDGHDQDLYDRGLLHVNDPRRAGAPTVPARRDPTAATRPVQWQTPGQPMVPEWDADTATRWAYYANVIAWRCIDLRARTVAALPFRAGTDMPDRPGEAAPHNPRSRLAQLLGPPPGGPAPKLTARRLWDWTMRQKLVTGRWGWEVETTGAGAGGQVAALWPLVSGSLRAIPTTSGTEWFGRFEYGPASDSRSLPADRVIYGWHPMMSDFRQPESAFQAARLDLSIAVMGDRYSYAFLKNGAVPAYVVTTTEFPTESLREAFRSQWKAAYQGPDAAGSTHFHEVTEDGAGSVGDAIDIKTVALSQKDSQFVAQHQASLERVAIALGVPWSKLDASGRTFDNAAQEDRDFWTMTVLDDLRDLTDEINLQLAPRVGGEVGWFDTSGVEVLKTAPLFNATDAVAMVSARIITRNEARVPFGLPAIDGGDVLDQPVVPAPMPPQLAAANDLGRGGADAANNKSRTNDLTGSDRLDVPDPPAPETRALSPEEHEQRRAAVWRRHDSIVRGLEVGFERRMRRLFARQAKLTLARLEGNRGRALTRDPAAAMDPAHIFDAAFWRAEAADVSSDAFEAIFAAGGARVSDQFGLSFDLQAPYATQFIEARANQLAGAVTDTTYSQITAALAQGALEGDDIPALAERVRHVFEVADTARATTIARTETISAYNGSASAVASSYGQDVVGGQEWISTVDGRTRPEHAGADGQVIGIGQAFDVGGELLAYPGDPNGDAGNVVNCRCTVAFLTPAEMGERGVRPVGRRMSIDAGARVLELVARVRSPAA